MTKEEEKKIRKAIKAREKNGVKPPHRMIFRDSDGILIGVIGNSADEIIKKLGEGGYTWLS